MKVYNMFLVANSNNTKFVGQSFAAYYECAFNLLEYAFLFESKEKALEFTNEDRFKDLISKTKEDFKIINAEIEAQGSFRMIKSILK